MRTGSSPPTSGRFRSAIDWERSDSDSASVATHELGHMFHDVVKGLKTAQQQFYVRRTKTSRLELVVGGRGTGTRPEYGRRDEFIHWYIGRDYGRLTREAEQSGIDRSDIGQAGKNMPSTRDSSEVLTMGMQSLFHAELAGPGEDIWFQDPDMRDFILGLLVSI